jgi:hypothetical protein
MEPYESNWAHLRFSEREERSLRFVVAVVLVVAVVVVVEGCLVSAYEKSRLLPECHVAHGARPSGRGPRSEVKDPPGLGPVGGVVYPRSPKSHKVHQIGLVRVSIVYFIFRFFFLLLLLLVSIIIL